MKLMPQELETWYILPALRKEFTEVLSIQHKMKQKDIAKILGVTEAAISQYRKNKRGKDVKFCNKIKKEIAQSAEAVAKDESSFNKELQKIFRYMRDNGHICEIHRQLELIPAKCDVCIQK